MYKIKSRNFQRFFMLIQALVPSPVIVASQSLQRHESWLCFLPCFMITQNGSRVKSLPPAFLLPSSRNSFTKINCLHQANFKNVFAVGNEAQRCSGLDAPTISFWFRPLKRPTHFCCKFSASSRLNGNAPGKERPRIWVVYGGCRLGKIYFVGSENFMHDFEILTITPLTIDYFGNRRAMTFTVSPSERQPTSFMFIMHLPAVSFPAMEAETRQVAGIYFMFQFRW